MLLITLLLHSLVSTTGSYGADTVEVLHVPQGGVDDETDDVDFVVDVNEDDVTYD